MRGRRQPRLSATPEQTLKCVFDKAFDVAAAIYSLSAAASCLFRYQPVTHIAALHAALKEQQSPPADRARLIHCLEESVKPDRRDHPEDSGSSCRW